MKLVPECRHERMNAATMQMALMRGSFPGPRHILPGLLTTTGAPKTWRPGRGAMLRALTALAALFVARTWTYDQPYWVALLWALLALVGVLLLGSMLYGWALENGYEPCDCDD